MNTGNQPYVKEYNDNGEVTNAITLDKPFENAVPMNRASVRGRGKYITLVTTGFKQIKLKVKGNNRKSTCKGKRKDKESRFTL